MKFKSMALAILASAVSTLAIANVSVADLAARGDGLLVVDSQSNLAWLALTQTRGQSLDQVTAAGWLAQGFKLATQVQLDALIEEGETVPLLSWLDGQKLTGPLTPEGFAWYRSSVSGAIAGDFASQGQIVVKTLSYGPIITSPTNPYREVTPGDRGWWNEGDNTSWTPSTLPDPASLGGYEVFSSTSATWFTAQDSNIRTGFFLVKDLPAVPEPTTWLLMGLGLVALSIARSRHHPG
ncbi:MAG: PEP-CTERM sorting domain-containing protein [Aquabacterium sp.]|uniref:PEP-CTERM sorting domain-containing protein n=1 Tax=Aquabacterium sp. TaxID=1872578 RepID=UPI002718C28D|nr:PEP-CTERM sorting domain-containing protein [Aquabacterium sp.]MDO9005148.1 PEP-CTERM sorting domain-containing protein [Aquabacterium sp.]